MIYIGIDQSLSATGICVTGKDMQILSIETIVSDKLRGVERLFMIVEHIKNIILQLEDDIVVVREGYSYQSKGHVFELGELGGAIDLMLYNLKDKKNITEYVVPPTLWKKFIFGSGDTKKDTKYLLKAFKKTGIEFDNDNEADSYMILKYFKCLIEDIISRDEKLELTTGQREACLSPDIRKKNKITKKNIGDINDSDFKNLTEASICQYRR